ncbi:hypothetical protein Rhopal_004132-T1 [Rhodotorula paludigena]|uniref:Uncharacterized protein n=1 Tax=Rhodotorula paludigena TaxID=86838 RepID=A0AAV5GPD1_9BASI|nr:hypothetical protein Rhopal_004132-T1 [Rhodotorula paludigena]
MNLGDTCVYHQQKRGRKSGSGSGPRRAVRERNQRHGEWNDTYATSRSRSDWRCGWERRLACRLAT